MCLVSLDDPGLTVFGYHRLLTNLGEPGRAGGARRGDPRALRDRGGRRSSELDPAGEDGIGVFGYIDAHHRQRLPAAAQGPGGARRARSRALRGLPDARRRDPRDAAPARRARDERRGHRGEARDRLHGVGGAGARRRSTRATHAAFLLRPTPVEQVRAVAAAGETMPPKSTYFFPKLLTGIVFNPLS